METSLVVIIFNRPQKTKLLRDQLKPVESRDLYLISDGPRENRPGESELVEKCRNYFNNWGGTVKFNCSDTNMGCKKRISSGLNWVFEQTDSAIILEDDCLPEKKFFKYCDSLLVKYQDFDEVMSICGSKTYPKEVMSGDYFFSKYNNCWGWATWKRAWDKYDDRFDEYSFFHFTKLLKDFLGTYRAAIYWYFIMNMVLTGRLSSWAYCWMISCFLNEGLHIYPKSNLIINSGFGSEATHTIELSPFMPQNYGDNLSTPLNHPKNISACEVADRWIEDNMYSKKFIRRLEWVYSKIKSIHTK